MKRLIMSCLTVCAVYAVQAQLVLDRCDVYLSWISDNTLMIDDSDKIEGRASLKFTGSESNWFEKEYSSTKPLIDNTGYLTLSLFISDAALLSSEGYIEINSSGVIGEEALRWNTSTINLVNGWNEVSLQINQGTILGSFSLQEIRYFKIFQPISAEVTAAIDLIKFVNNPTISISDDPLAIGRVDPSTLDGKVMFGYQGWFSSIGDGSTLGDRYHHWGNLANGDGHPNNLGVEMWFDDDEFDPDELFKTGYRFSDGTEARSFSSYTKKTVFRHMKWIRDYDIDGVFLQRFMSEARDRKFGEFRDSVAVHVMQGSERYGRTFAMMWDGLAYAAAADEIIADWKYLVDEIKLTESPNYLHHRGRPLISLWGYTVRDDAKVEDLERLIEFFHNAPEEKYRASVKLGSNHEWRTQENGKWVDAFKKVEVISPWTVGRYGSSKSGYEDFARRITEPDLEWCNENNIDYLPVNWPGFSWFNLKAGPKNQHARRGGDFFWEQASGNISRGAKSLYIAMFDEVDEATSFFKMPENDSQSPAVGYWLDLNEDGRDLPSDWYLRSVKTITQVMRGNIDNREELGTPLDGIDGFKIRATHATCTAENGSLTISLPTLDKEFEFSLDNGQTYEYNVASMATELNVDNLLPGLYNVWVRYTDGSFATDLGDVLIISSTPELTLTAESASCVADGKINIEIGTNPYLGPVEISLDGGASYTSVIEDKVYMGAIENLNVGTYDVYARWENTTCGQLVQQIEVVSNLDKPEMEIRVFDERSTGDVCLGSSVKLFAKTGVEVSEWKWTGPNGFEQIGEEVLVTDSLLSNQSGYYVVQYTDMNACVVIDSLALTNSDFTVPVIDFLIDAEGDFLNPTDIIMCEGKRLVLEASPNNDAFSYTWTGPDDFRKTGRRATLSVAASDEIEGEYSLTVSDGDCFIMVTKTITVGDAENCGVTVKVLDTDLTDISLQIYPNPSQEYLTIKSDSKAISAIQIVNSSGAKVWDKNYNDEQVEINALDIECGIYFLLIQFQDGTSAQRKFLRE